MKITNTKRYKNMMAFYCNAIHDYNINMQNRKVWCFIEQKHLMDGENSKHALRKFALVRLM